MTSDWVSRLMKQRSLDTAMSIQNNQQSQISLPDWLSRATNYPQRIALQDRAEYWSFAELDQRAARLARQLATAGVREGDRVALLAANGLPYAACVHALTRLGAVLLPLNLRLTASELCWQLTDVRATLLIHDGAQATTAAAIAAQLPALRRATLAHEAANGELTLDTLAEANSPLRSEIDLAATQAIMYTSGTTGQPKGALITYGMHWWNATGSALNLGLRPDDCWLACLPLFHIGGLSILMRSVIYGMRVLMFERFDAAAINDALLHEQVSGISVVTVMLQRLLADLDARGDDAGGRYPSTLRCVLLGGGPAPRPLLEDCARRQLPVAQTYGLTESCSQATTLSPEDALRKLGSAGRPLLPVQVRIVEEGQALPAGEAGEIMLRGPTITPGYAERPQETRRAFHDGWFATGDFGYLDEDGYLYVLDRRSDLIISGGENVYPAEIEAALLGHSAVAEAGVCGAPDKRWGQAPIAFVVLGEGQRASEQDILAYLARQLARYKLPRAVHFVQQLPRTASGKLMRRELPALLSNS